MAAPSQPQVNLTRTWDPLVKLTHWGIVTLVVINALVVEEGSGWHIWAGYALAALLALRLLWGLTGPPEARFSAFPPSAKRAFEHIGEIRRREVKWHRSHNPLGALMVYALWLCLGIIIASGIAMAGPPPTDPNISEAAQERDGGLPVGYDVDVENDGAEHEEGLVKEIHETAVNVLYVLIGLHLLGVIFETRRSGRGIVLAMLPGHRETPE
jgi:cytochrome b